MTQINRNSRILIRAGGIRDAAGHQLRPGAILIEDGKVGWTGPTHEAPAVPIDALIERPDHLLLPALVNAHTHLDLTAIGPQPPAESFADWVDNVRRLRPVDPESIRDSTHMGIELSLAGGTGVVGDIAGSGSTIPLDVLRTDGRLAGVCFVEFFGLTGRDDKAHERMTLLAASESGHAVGLGLQPHAPYSASRRLYEHAADLARKYGTRCATHLAETREEIEFTTHGTGPIAGFLKRIDVWDGQSDVTGQHPLEALIDPLTAAPWTIAHGNYLLKDRDLLRRLAAAGSAVVYCPRAHAYFSHRDHPYRILHDYGVNVALGTDSIVNLDTPDRISILDEMSLLYQRDHGAPGLLMEMATINGARALGLDPDSVTFKPGPTIGVIAIPFNASDHRDPLEQVLSQSTVIDRRPQPIEWILGPGFPEGWTPCV